MLAEIKENLQQVIKKNDKYLMILQISNDHLQFNLKKLKDKGEYLNL